MKFGTLLELNSNIEWWDYYVDYDALKKLFPSTPLDPSYRATHQNNESSAILPFRRASNKYASPEEFKQALDKERNKVTEFYKSKFEELTRSFEQLEEEIAGLEERDLQDDTIKEVNEEDEDAEEGQGERQDIPSTRETDNLLGHSSSPTRARSPNRARSPLPRPRPSFAGRLGSSFNFGRRKSAALPNPRDPDILEASIQPTYRSSQSANATRPRMSDSMTSSYFDEHAPGRVPGPRSGRRVSDFDASADDIPVFVWTANNDYATVLRIGLKKRISKVWLDAYALKQYVELNMTAFEKILKKYDKNTDSKLKKQYISEVVLQSVPWTETSKKDLEEFLTRILFLYRRVVAGGDDDIAREQLRSQLREKVVVDRETVWSQMVSGRNRSEGIFRSVTPDQIASTEPNKNVLKTPCGSFRVPTWLTMKAAMVILATVSSILIVHLQPLERVEESNCMAMLVFCIILWATEAIPLFVTSLAVPFLTVTLRVLRSSDGEDERLSAADATKYIFSQMFSPTIMLLIGGFTIAAVLSKTRLDVMTATRILNAAGSNPSVVLLVLMSVATFATNIGGQASPISSPQNLISLGAMDPPLSWLQWFAISIPVSTLSILLIWAFLHINYRWESDLEIPKMRKNTDSLTVTHYYVLSVSALTILLWCAEKSLEDWVGDMGIIAIVPLLAFFGTGILSKEDFHSFHWSIVFLAMGGVALGKATLSSGLLDMLNSLLEGLVEGMGLYSILIVFSVLALVIATFITQENKLGQRFIGASDFLKNGILSSILAMFVIVTVGYAIMRTLGL
ncbi:phosphate transporter [Cryptococcus deuterogattii 99/473]|uniref:Unplaced genomic scaffold supercont1.16, whole genome shotgun sequence n=1 Tax=Cryptococcus deuterogattii Ram5 TaxID=1296110 RepID=A0A0D0SYE4_9TREE|nr:phosphate transporter [Cryptococcus deuterogattii LA55]KIR34752.1 phosphate transporter [Cryptococcus deuterogattii MMRL2647]KIR38212.1 phosphate transporter [Cryptococcus deuterogattii Ram5]KIR73649.1 phosphate transporter [Cryptococcus deuterogattii CA1014]KIR93139.1 phosphate transporter [Cryptococcus deuterogattii CBS 10090]KIR99597.1 phosphate transporter [Cryptococcus deuterogattii 2001/935-1]KIY58210.1 phosphate transporter [Cryptococcus deuterogattii 99/473]